MAGWGMGGPRWAGRVQGLFQGAREVFLVDIGRYRLTALSVCVCGGGYCVTVSYQKLLEQDGNI